MGVISPDSQSVFYWIAACVVVQVHLPTDTKIRVQAIWHRVIVALIVFSNVMESQFNTFILSFTYNKYMKTIQSTKCAARNLGCKFTQPV